MAEYIAEAAQTVASNQNVLFLTEIIPGSCAILHRPNSGIITLRGLTNQCRARFKVSYNGNTAVPSGGTAEAFSTSICVNGETLGGTTMVVTPAATQDYSNISASTFIDVPRGCCINLSIKNVSSQSLLYQNSNLIVERVA